MNKLDDFEVHGMETTVFEKTKLWGESTAANNGFVEALKKEHKGTSA